MTNYHPDNEVLLEFSAGTVSSHFALCVSVHLKYCKQCRETVARMQAVGGVLFEELPSTPVSDGLFDRILDRVEHYGDRQVESEAEPLSLLKGWLPDGLKNLSWRKQWFKLSEVVLEVPKSGNWRLALQRISAGGIAPLHGHHGREVTVVLQGGFSDESGVYNEGDFIICDGENKHRPQAFRNEDCICLTFLEAPVSLEGPVGRWIERFKGLFGTKEPLTS